MSTSSILILITTFAGLLTLWRDEIIAPKVLKSPDENDEEKAKRLADELKQEKTKRIKIISSVFIVLTLIFTLYQTHVTKVAADLQRDKDSLAYSQLEYTYKNSIENGIAVTNIRKASQSILDSLDSVRHKVESYSSEQISSLKNISTHTFDLLNPIPEHIVIAWFGKFRVSSEAAKALNEKLKALNTPSNDGHFILNDTFLFEHGSFFEPFDQLYVHINSKTVNIRYSGSLRNYFIPINRSFPLTENSTEYTNVLYDSIRYSLEFEGTARLKIDEMSLTAKSLKSIEKCDIVFQSNLINGIGNTSSVNFFMALGSKIKVGQYRMRYDKRSEGYKMVVDNIFQETVK